jgi:hypothetical protein
MNRILLPIAVAALLAGCTMPSGLGQQSNQPAVADPPQTTVVREVHYTEPVVYTETVYVPEQAPYQEPVYAGDEYNTYNEYNEYNESYVYVNEHVVIPPPHPQEPRWSPRGREQPRDRSGDGKPPERRNPPSDPNQPRVVVPPPPTKRTYVPVANDRQGQPVPLTPPYQAVQPTRRAPATPDRTVVPKQVPAPLPGKSTGAKSDSVQVRAARRSSKVVSPGSSAGQVAAANTSQSASAGR